MHCKTLPAVSALIASLSLALVLAAAVPARAHFGMVIPDTNVVTKDGDKTVKLKYLFWHPMENQGMNLAKPKVEAVVEGKKQDLSASLKETKTGEFMTWASEFAAKKPGVVTFLMTPQPYFEKAEDKFIQHLTKTVVGVLGEDEGWDKPVGAKMEIVPLTRPFGLYAPGSFTGKVLFQGKALAGAELEVEFMNADGALKAPSDPYVTLSAKADSNGVFTFTAPWAGWWGFAALTEDKATMKLDGKDKKVEVGGVLWVYFHPALK
jgi:cobalt/nickel transport protein